MGHNERVLKKNRDVSSHCKLSTLLHEFHSWAGVELSCTVYAYHDWGSGFNYQQHKKKKPKTVTKPKTKQKSKQTIVTVSESYEFINQMSYTSILKASGILVGSNEIGEKKGLILRHYSPLHNWFLPKGSWARGRITEVWHNSGWSN